MAGKSTIHRPFHALGGARREANNEAGTEASRDDGRSVRLFDAGGIVTAAYELAAGDWCHGDYG